MPITAPKAPLLACNEIQHTDFSISANAIFRSGLTAPLKCIIEYGLIDTLVFSITPRVRHSTIPTNFQSSVKSQTTIILTALIPKLWAVTMTT